MVKKVKLMIVSQEGTWYRGFTVPAGGWIGIDEEKNFFAGSGWECRGLYYAYQFNGQNWQECGWVELVGTSAQLERLQDLAQRPDLKTIDYWKEE